MRALAAALLITAVAGGCATRVPIESPTVPPATTPAGTTTPATPSGIVLTVTASGPIEVQPPFGSQPVLTIRPGLHNPNADWTPTQDDPRFDVVAPPAGSTDPFRASGPARGAPETLEPGPYWVGAGVGIVSDFVSPGFPPGFVGTAASCFANLTVDPSSTGVSIQVLFAGDRCTIRVAQH